MNAFSLLHEGIREALKELGLDSPTEIQELAVPSLLAGRDALLIAPTGIGKTEAALLPVFHRFLESRPKGISILYVTPLRALNRDILERFEWWSKRLGMKIEVRHGDTSQYARRKQALSPPDMLITTPETLQAILPGRVMREHLRNVRVVVVDEVHELAEDKRGAQLSVALERLLYLTGREFQRIGISATIGSPEVVARFLGGKREVRVLKVSPSKDIVLKVVKPTPNKEDKEIAARIFSTLEASARIREILNVVRQHTSVLIFVNTREMAETLASRFRLLDEKVGIHHSSLSQEARVRAEKEFKNMEVNALICTSSLELGIDIGSVEAVVQYKSPKQVTRLLQRIGRSGHRIGQTSKGIIIATDADDILESAVIARRALMEELEEIQLPYKPYDVLAHQLVGIALDRREVPTSEALNLLRSAAPFEDLEEDELESVLKLMAFLRLIWINDESFSLTRNSRKYYYENLSTIPDEKRYIVKNIVSRERIGALDEAFVVNYAAQGNLIIFRGAPWRIISIEDDVILVEPVEEVIGAIPSWIGEEIPVPYEVAIEAGRLRMEVAERGAEALKNYPLTSYAKKQITSKIKKHIKKGHPIPGHQRIVVEIVNDYIIIHACFGMRVNQALGRLFSALLTSKQGHEVTLKVDAYRIILQSPREFKIEDLKELFNIEPEVLEPLLKITLRTSPLFRWKFLHVAKRFGVISREASYADISLRRVIDSYEDSPVHKETLKEIFMNNLGLMKAVRVLGDIRKGRIRVEYREGSRASPLAELGLQGYGEILLPKRAERLILRALEKRLGDRRVELLCLYCASWQPPIRVKNLEERPTCKNCGARMLAVLKGRYKELRRLYKKFRRREELTQEEAQEVARMQASGNLVLSYGKRAVVAMAGRGVGPETAKRVLLATRRDDELFRNILRAERNYARTRRFWD
jgi:ATP-dependent Lhr-like helicase